MGPFTSANAMQHPLLLGRDSLLECDTCTYSSAAVCHLDTRVFGEYVLKHYDFRIAEAYVPMQSAQSGNFHLRSAGTKRLSRATMTRSRSSSFKT